MMIPRKIIDMTYKKGDIVKVTLAFEIVKAGDPSHIINNVYVRICNVLVGYDVLIVSYNGKHFHALISAIIKDNKWDSESI